jgi:hypothetical protein
MHGAAKLSLFGMERKMLNPVVKWGLWAAAVVWAGAAGAMPINGSLTLGSGGVSPDPGSLDTVTSFTAPGNGFYSVGSGDFNSLTSSGSGLTQLLSFTPSPISIPSGTGTASSGLKVTGSGAASGFGTFSASSVQAVARDANFLDLYFLGTYTPSFSPSGGGTFDADEAASLRIDLTRTGNATGGYSVSLAGTLAVPPTGTGTPVSEPISLAILGGGLLGLGLVRRLRAT